MSGIDGSFDIHAERGTVRLQVNKLYPSRQEHHTSDLTGNDGGGSESDNVIGGSKERVSRGSYASAPEGHIIAVVDPEVRLCALIILFCHDYECLTV